MKGVTDGNLNNSSWHKLSLWLISESYLFAIFLQMAKDRESSLIIANIAGRLLTLIAYIWIIKEYLTRNFADV